MELSLNCKLNPARMQWQNELTAMLKIEYPVIQAPMLGITTPAMVAAVSNAGGLGSLPVGGLSPDKTRALIRETKALTQKPFAVNLFAHDVPTFDKAQVETMQLFLEEMCAENGLPFAKQDVNAFHFYHYTEQIEVLLNENIPVVSFTFGVLNDESIKAFKQKHIVLIGTATCLKEAQILDEKQIDAICAQGIEAGGHRGTFLEDEPLPLVPSASLVSQIISNTSKPVVWAGGLANGKAMKAAFTVGAQGIQLGTAFIASNESTAIPAYKEGVKNAPDADIVLTRAFSGRWARGIRNRMMSMVENSDLVIPAYPIQNSLTGLLRAEAQKQNNADFTNLWAGQSAYKSEAKPAADIFKDIIRLVEEES